MKRFITIIAMIFMFCVFALKASAQDAETAQFLSWFPLITFIAMAVLSYLNVSMMQKQGKLKEDILNIVRSELKCEIASLEKVMVTKEQLAGLKELNAAILSRIELKIDNAAKQAEGVAFELQRKTNEQADERHRNKN